MSEWQRTVKLGKRDRTEPAVIAAFLAGGADACVKHSGRDEPDLFVAFLGAWFPVETKSDAAKLSEGQVRWWREVAKEPPRIARTAPQAKKLLRLWSDKVTGLSSPLRANAALDAIESQGGGVDAAMEDSMGPCNCDRCTNCAGKVVGEPA